MLPRVFLLFAFIFLTSVEGLAQTHLSSIGGIRSLPVRRSWSPRNGSTIAYQVKNASFTIIEAQTGRVIRLEQGESQSSYPEYGSIYTLPSSTADTTFMIRQSIVGKRSAQLVAIETSSGRDLYTVGPFSLYSGSVIGGVQFDLHRQVVSLIMCQISSVGLSLEMTGFYSIDLRDRSLHETVLDSIQRRHFSQYQEVIPSILDLKASSSQFPDDVNVSCRMGNLAVLSSRVGDWKTALYDTATRSIIFRSNLQYLAADKDQLVLVRPSYMSERLDKKYGLIEIYRWKDPTTLFRAIQHAIDDEIAQDQFHGSEYSIVAGRYVARLVSNNGRSSTRAFDLLSGRQSSIEIEIGDHVSFTGTVVKFPSYRTEPVIRRYSFDGMMYDSTRVSLGDPSLFAVHGSAESLHVRSQLAYNYGSDEDDVMYDARILDNAYEPGTTNGQAYPRTQEHIVNMVHSALSDSLYVTSYIAPKVYLDRPIAYLMVEKLHVQLTSPSRLLNTFDYYGSVSGQWEWRNLAFDPFHERVIEIYNSMLVFKDPDTATTFVLGIPRSFLTKAMLADSGRFLCSDSAVIRLSDRRIVQTDGWSITPLHMHSKWAIVRKGAVYGLADISLDRVFPFDSVSLAGSARRSPYVTNGVNYVIDSTSSVYGFDTSGRIRLTSRLEADTLLTGLRFIGFSENGLFAKATYSEIVTWDLLSGKQVQRMTFPVNRSMSVSISPTDGRIIFKAASGAIFWGQAPVVTTVQEEQKPPIDLRSQSTNMRMVSREDLLTESNLNGDMTLFDLQGRQLTTIQNLSTPATIVVRKGDSYSLTLLIDP